MLLLGGAERFSPALAASTGTLGAPVCLVWVTEGVTADDRADLDELRSRVGLEQVASGATYVIYLGRP